MSDENSLPQWSLNDLARRCAEETDRFRMQRNNDPRFCFEIFQRAFANNNQAWDVIYIQYQPQVARWVKNHSGFESTGEEIEYFVLGAFAKFWNAMMPDRFREFPDLGHLLRYIQLCVHSVITDYNRACDLAETYAPGEEPSAKEKPDPRNLEVNILSKINEQKCRDWIDNYLHDEKERLVLRLYIDEGLKPREIYAQFPDKFQDIDEVYRIRQNVITRLGRNPEFLQACGDDD